MDEFGQFRATSFSFRLFFNSITGLVNASADEGENFRLTQ